MNYRKLGKTRLEISEIGLGCWQLGGKFLVNGMPITIGSVNEKTSEDILTSTLEYGINFFDTADVYSLGKSEEILGNVLKKYRNEIKIATKAGSVLSKSNKKPFQVDLSKDHLISSLNKSLNRLKTDYVDIFLTHFIPYSDTEFESIEKAFSKIKSEGKAIACGVSISEEYEKALELLEKDIVDCIEITYSMLNYEPENEIFQLAKKKNVGIITSKTFSQGFLIKKNLNFGLEDVRSTYNKKKIELLVKRREKFFEKFKLEELKSLAIPYVVSNKDITSCLIGVTNTVQLEQNMKYYNNLLKTKDRTNIKYVQSRFHTIE